MSSRRYPTAELYEERQREFYRNGNRSNRSYSELDEEITRSDYRPGRTPEFLRDDYGRTSAGQLVVRERVTEEIDRPRPRPREVEKEEIIIRDRRDSARPREVEREEIHYRRDDGPRRPREAEETDIVVRRREHSRTRPREVEREEIDIRHETREGRSHHTREVSRESREFEVRRGPGRPPREVEREEVIYRRGEREDRHAERGVTRDTIIIRPRERSLPPPRLVAREHEDFVIRRHRSPSPAPIERKEEIVIRRTERERDPSPAPPSPIPLEPIVRPPIVQEVITHHRHIDHGVERARSLSPHPRSPSPSREESLEIAIRRRNTEGLRAYDEDIIYERETRERRERDRGLEVVRRRSLSAPRRRYLDDDIEAEADFYNRKVAERAYVGEAYNGATKDWAIVDVPPGTKRVRMDGAGGGSQEITWQRYNGVRRSKFITEDDVYGSEFGAPAPHSRKKDMWTEITKDLVLKDAIESMGYEYEETEYFYYVMEYLRYEDVLQLVELSADIRRNRRDRLREIQWERSEWERRRPVDERIYEREFIYDRHRSGGRYR